ncbi:MAG TPA: 2-isopropylmalate synthase, partial [Bacteroidetes bacterium]|nr:2-isopropylmalate synthase [Bacteroidota bacterium]
DGEQSPGFSMNLEEKLRLALQLERLGVDVIEAGFPIASQGDFEAVREIARTIQDCRVAGLARARLGDIDRAWEALQHARHPRIHTFIATSDIHLEHKLHMTRRQALQDAVRAVEYAHQLCEEVEFSAEDASRSDPDFLVEIFTAAIEAGASVINVPDTVGYSHPWEFGALIRTLRERIPNINQAILSVHCHNDLGLAVANSLAAIREGAQQVECTINGIGERAGNAALEEIVMAIDVRRSEFDAHTGIRTTELYPTSRLLVELTGKDVQVNKPIVGDNAFAHEAGIHQDGVLKNPMTYEIMTPQRVGIPSNKIVMGKHSGRRALRHRLELLGFRPTREELEELYRRFTELADRQKEVSDEQLAELARQICAKRLQEA